ncbi:2-phosphoglycerate kinase [Proteiniclasticum sp.]|uniref:2-phosphoglycerate kinase n=1 Tax=Proteiniclasticum sp. TaxID=2053595 RepID=UPI0028A2632E|nr:2-phosphoglycerate kinase [Proteiniclasticum sp.]
MIILIGGVSCTGKTFMAQTLMEKYKIPYFSIDHLKMGLIRASSYCDFKASDPDIEITRKIWPVVREMIRTILENNQHIIVEGCYIPPDAIRDFTRDDRKQIISLFLGFSEDYIRMNFERGIIAHRSEIEFKEIDDYMTPDNFSRLHAEARDRMENSNYFEIHNDYEKEIEGVYSWIDLKAEEINTSGV